MLRVLLAAAALLGLAGAQDMPVARPSGPSGQAGPPSIQQPQRQLPPLPASQIDPGDATLDSPRRLTLSFAEPRPIDEVLALLTTGTGFSLSIDSDVSGAFRGELKGLTLRESLTAMLDPLGLDFDAQGTVIRVRRRQLRTRLFEIDILNVQRGLSRAAGTSAASVSTGVPPEDVLNGIADGVKSLLSERGTVHVDRRAGLVQVTDVADRLDRVALYVEAVQQRSGRQVRLQAQAFEITLRDVPTIDWRLVRERLGLPAGAPDAGLAVDPDALRTALGAQGDVRLLWAPDVTTINNEPALVRMAASGGITMTMTVVPQISADGIVQMSVSHALDEPAGERKTGWFTSTPVVRASEADTVMRVRDGSTVLVAGLLRPGAELVVLLRPTIVTPGSFTAANRH